MATPVDHLQRDKRLQEHWVRRVVAFIIDWIIIWVVLWVLSLFLFFGAFGLFGFGWFFMWSFFGGVLFFLYAGFLEGTRGATIGKALLRLRVVSFYGNMDIGKGFIRNVTKIFWLFLLLDLLLAFFTSGEPRQRYMDRISNTTVTDIAQPAPYHQPFPGYHRQ